MIRKLPLNQTKSNEQEKIFFINFSKVFFLTFLLKNQIVTNGIVFTITNKL